MDKETPISFDHLLPLWEKAFLNLVPVALNASGWTNDGKPVTSGDARIALAAAWADLVITEHAKRFAPQSNAAGHEGDKEGESHHGHTPGPWTHRNGRIFAADRESLTIAHVARSADGDYSPANARLIAAAPELLQSCRGMLHALETDCRDTNKWAELMGEAVAAIAKATGSQT